MKHIAPPRTTDLLAEAIAQVRADIEAATSLQQRARIFWAGVAASRNLGAFDVVAEDFWTLAFEVLWKRRAAEGKDNSLPYNCAAYETTCHLIRWGLLARDPFGAQRT